MTTYDYESDRTDFLDRFDLGSARPSNLLMPSVRFQVFALIAILAGAALAFVT